MTVTPSSPAASERLHALDAVRGGALLLGVAFHATLSFLPGPQIWVVRDTQSDVLGAVFIVTHIFRMMLFFVIAGYFGRMLLHRGGTGRFVLNRVRRIGLPMVAFWPIVFTAIISCFLWGVATMNGGVLPTDGPPPPPLTLATFPLTHLWFLYMLLLLYAGMLVLRTLARVIDSRGILRAGPIDRAMQILLATPLGVVIFAAPLALALANIPIWYAAAGIPTPDTGFVPNVAALTGFGTAFAFGWLLQRQRSLLHAIQRWWPVYLMAAAALTLYCVRDSIGPEIFNPLADGPGKLVFATVYALAAWTWTLGLIGAALTFLSRERRAVRYIADASYWVYLMHLPVVMALQILVYPLAAPALVKFALVIAGAFLILFASYHLLVRHSWIGAWLNGRKRAWRRPQPELETHTT